MSERKVCNKIRIDELKQRIEHIKKNNKILDKKYFVKLQEMIKAKQKKEYDKKYYNFYFDNETAEAFHEFCIKTNISKTDGLELLIDVAVDTYDDYIKRDLKFTYVKPEEKTKYLKQKSGEKTKKERVNKRNYQFWLDNKTEKKFDEFCERVNISKTNGLEFLLKIGLDTFDKYNEKQEELNQ